MENPELENAIFAAPDKISKRDAWAVYGDWLQGQGDPRGELIALELARKKSPKKNKNLKKRIKELYKNNRKTWAPGLSREKEEEDDGIIDWKWKYGYINALDLYFNGPEYPESWYDDPDSLSKEEEEKLIQLQLEKIQQQLTPTTLKFLQALEITLEGDSNYLPKILESFQILSHLKLLTDIEITFLTYDDGPDYLSDYLTLLEKSPALLKLNITNALTNHKSPIPSFTHPTLKTLQVYQSEFQPRLLELLSRSNLPALNKLTLEFWSLTNMPDKNELWPAFHNFFQAGGLPRLKELTIEIEPAKELRKFIIQFAGTPLLKNLNKLTIVGGKLKTSAAQDFLKLNDAYAHLKEIRFQNPNITSKLEKKIETRLKGKTRVIFG